MSVTLSSKNQITIPAAAVRALGLKPGDKLRVKWENGRLILEPRPRRLVDYLGASMAGYYGRNKEEIEAYLAEVRGDWGTP